MKYWFIIHSLEAYHQHPDYIGKKKRSRKIEKVKRGDRIIYYATGDSVVVGSYDVVKGKEEYTDDERLKEILIKGAK